MALLIEKFQTAQPEIVSEMKRCSHHFSEDSGIFSPYHLEGDVWSHTMMVHKNSHDLDLVSNETYFDILNYATMFHDLGKIKTRVSNPETQRVNFYGHAGVSVFMAIDAFEKMQEVDIQPLSNWEFTTMLKVISLHHSYMNPYMDLLDNDNATSEKLKRKIINRFKYEPDLFNLLLQHMKCDSLGRFSSVHPTEKWMVEHLEKRFEECITKQINDTGPNKLDKNKPTVTLMVGPPGSGKSTYIFGIEQAHKRVLSRDDILMEMGDSSDYAENWESVSQEEVDAEFHNRLRNFIDRKESFIVDRTNVSTKIRNQVLSHISKDYNKEAIVMLVGYNTILNRNSTRKEKTINKDVILNMMKSFSMPMYDQFDNIEYVSPEIN